MVAAAIAEAMPTIIPSVDPLEGFLSMSRDLLASLPPKGPSWAPDQDLIFDQSQNVAKKN